jgi:hypothetical protein
MAPSETLTQATTNIIVTRSPRFPRVEDKEMRESTTSLTPQDANVAWTIVGQYADSKSLRALRHLVWIEHVIRFRRRHTIASSFLLRHAFRGWRSGCRRLSRPHVASFRRRLHSMSEPILISV